MPLYEYECSACGHRFEQIQKFSDPPIEACPKCGQAQVQKLLSSPAIQFKGSGWYITDYARKGESGDATAKSGDKGTKPAASESGGSSEKPAAASSDAAPAASPAKSS